MTSWRLFGNSPETEKAMRRAATIGAALEADNLSAAGSSSDGEGSPMKKMVLTVALVSLPVMARADCKAWVLWLSKQEGVGSRETGWQIKEAFPDFESCDRMLTRIFWPKEHHDFGNGHIVDSEKGVIRMVDRESQQWMHAYCLPDTVDPRDK